MRVPRSHISPGTLRVLLDDRERAQPPSVRRAIGHVAVGPGRGLADFGSGVVRIESRKRMDFARANRIPRYGELPVRAPR